MKYLLLLIMLLAVVMFAACERPTSEQQNQGMQPVNRNTGTLPETPPSPEAPPAGGETPPSVPPAETSPVQPTTLTTPAFWNSTTGDISDLPSFPGGARMSVQYGPINGMDTAFIVLSTNQPLDTIAAFYENAIKRNGWSVVNKLTDPEVYKVTLKKDASNEAIVQVEKDPQTGYRRIVLTRLQKPKQPAAQPAEQPKPPNP
ncbi:MAG TPA: hypothetical protein VF131_17310 [Blastocatellia bacterium]|nr:hypothetical protein [Blastocatellia bacterium]